MLTVRCTKKLLGRLRVQPELRPAPSTTKLGDWYADTLNLGRERLVLCVSELTLLPVVVPAIGAGIDLDAKLARGLRETLEALGAPKAAIDAEVNQMLEVTIAKTTSRVVLGSMNEFQFMVRHVRNQHPMATLLELGLELAHVLCGAIDYDRPRDAALAALSAKPGQSNANLRVAPPPPPSTPKPRAISNTAARSKGRLVGGAGAAKALAERPEIEALLAKGKEQGFLTFDDVNDALPADIVSSAQIDDVMTMFGDNDIEIVDGNAGSPATLAPTPLPPAPTTLRSDYDVRYLADVLVEAARWKNSNSPDSTCHLTQAKAAADAFGMLHRDAKRSPRERDDAGELNALVDSVVWAIVSPRQSPFPLGLEGRPTEADRFRRRFRDRFEACERATTRVLDKMLMAVLEELVGAKRTISNDDLIRRGFDPWAAPPKSDDNW